MDVESEARALLARVMSDQVESEEGRIDDGGFWEEHDCGDRNLLLVWPEDRSITYFAARAPGFRRAGIVGTSTAAELLKAWLRGAAWSAEGLRVGNVLEVLR